MGLGCVAATLTEVDRLESTDTLWLKNGIAKTCLAALALVFNICYFEQLQIVKKMHNKLFLNYKSVMKKL